MSVPAISDRARNARRAFEECQAQRRPFEAGWQAVSDYFYPNASLTVTPTPGARRNRRVVTNTPRQNLKEAAALFIAYAVDTTQPFMAPNVNRSMAMSGRAVYSRDSEGRRLEMTAESRDYLDDLRWQLFDAQMLPQSGFVTAVARCGLEFLAFGNCVRWTGRRRGFGPVSMHRPLRSCWWLENEEGRIDTLFYRLAPLPVWRVKALYPQALDHPRFREQAEDEKKANDLVELLHVVEPRQGGVFGAVKGQKPFHSTVFMTSHDWFEVKDEGYDSFPYQVARMDRWEGSPYATGLGYDALPDAMALNHFCGGLERAIDLINDPVLFAPTRLFGNRLDRRPGQVNVYDPVNLGFQSLRDAIQKAEISGDPQWADRRIAQLTENIERVFFGNFTKLRDAANVTAEEIRERRDLRQRAISYLVPAFDRDMFGMGADRELEALIAEDLVPAPPPELSGLDVTWDYAGPLAKAKMLTQVDGALRLFDAASMAKQFDETAGDVVAVHEALRAINDSLGNAPGLLNSRAAVEAMRQARADQAAQQQANETLTAEATALRDAGQGLASIENAGTPGAMAA